jgi:hypothetical protein
VNHGVNLNNSLLMHIDSPLDEQSAAPGERNGIKALFIAAVIAVLVATLWPGDPFTRNGVTWLQGIRGLKFESPGLVVSKEYLKPAETQATESYSVELLVRPANRQSSTILAFYNDARPTQLLIGQDGERLLVTHDTGIQSDRTKTIEFHADHVFRPGRLVLVTISSGPSGTVVYLDGKTAGYFPLFKFSRSEMSGQIVLGTPPSMYEPWSGELRGLAIYSKELTVRDALQHYRGWMDSSAPHDIDGAIARYAFAEAAGREIRDDVPSGPNLEVPAIFSVPHKAFLRSAKKEFKASWRYAKDVAVNIAGFVPLGLIACAYLPWTKSRWKAILIATVACGVLSFVIEVLQYYLPRRFSGTTDIITNTLGAAVGAAIMQASLVRHVLKKLKLIRS